MQNEDSAVPSDKSGYHGDRLATVAAVSFFLLFPGFLFYHQLVAMGLTPPFAGGLFGYVSLGALLILLVLTPWHTGWLLNVIRLRYTQWTLAFLVYTSTWTIAHYFLIDGEHITIASIQSLEIIILWASLFLIGLLLPLESKALRWSFFISFIIILMFLIYFLVSHGDYGYYAQREYRPTTEIATYQGFARSALIILLLLMAVQNSFRTRAFLMFGGVFVLFMLFSRSDFYAFLAVSAVLCVIYGIKQPKYFLLLALVSLEVVLFAAPDIAPRIKVYLETRTQQEVAQAPTTDRLLLDDEGTQLSAPDKTAAADEAAQGPTTGQTSTQPPPATASVPRISRQFEVLDLSSSKSWAGRLALQRNALAQIAENPLMGKFGGHVLRQDTDTFTKDDAGSYAHNALSAWVNYGLAGFLIYAFLTLFGVVVCARQIILKRQNDPLWMFAFMVNFVSLLLIIASKSVFWPLPALGWGVTAKALIETKSTTGKNVA